MPQKKVIVVGAGPGGLTTTMLLAHKGYQVDVFEKQDYLGGRNAGFKLGGYTFDYGPTFLMMKNILEEVFTATGRSLDKYITTREIDPMYRLVYGPGRVFVPWRRDDKMVAELERLFPGRSAGYRRYMEVERKKYDKLIPCLQVPYSSLRDYLSTRFLKALPHLDAHVSLSDVLGRYFKENDLKLAFTFQAKYIGMSPWQAPGTFSIISYIEHGDGIYHVMGGLNQISQAMAKAAGEDGARIHLKRGVKKVLVANGLAAGVELEDGSREKADYVVLNADFAHAMTRLVDPAHRRKYTDEKLREKLYSCSTFMLYLGVGRTDPDISHHSIMFSHDYRGNAGDIADRKVLSADPSFYVQNASAIAPSLAPAGKAALYVLVPVPNNTGRIDWAKEKGPFQEKILRLLETKGGYTDLIKNIEEEKVVTPADWENEKFVYNGATFNLGHNVGQMLIFRPHNEFEEFKNCYLVGGGTHPGSGLPTIYESGRISAGLIMRRDGLT